MTEKEQIEKTLKRAKVFFCFGVVFVLLAPFLFTLNSCWSGLNFTATGQIGDTIGGITSPIVNLIGAVLVYYALKAQTQANLMVQDQFDEQKIKDNLQNESNDINQLYGNLKDSIDSFRFFTLDRNEFGNGEYLEGSEAIYKLFNDFYCNYHEDEEEMKCNPKLTELISILEICDVILSKLKDSKIPNREVMRMLTIHQFQYRIMPRINCDLDKLEKYKCDGCQTEHGLPDKVISLIKNITANSI
jgi:hypothetical protein